MIGPERGRIMASRAAGAAKQRIGTANWNALVRRALRRSVELGGATALFVAMLFLAVALVTYHQTDASSSTAAGGAVQNWMGPVGAWAADAALTLFGLGQAAVFLFGQSPQLAGEDIEQRQQQHCDKPE